MSDLVISGVTKRYWIRTHRASPNQQQARIFGIFRKPREVLAVNNVSFEVARGEAVGIVGHNGAGKSTILKVLSGITAPTTGEITIRGRLAALVEISAGFHPELTGRENIFVSGSILGMGRNEIAQKIEAIIEFSGVRTYIDVPVKRYSSGMSVRLGFSIAAHLEPDILLLDEVLAVGDAAFQVKCLDRVAELRSIGKTILFASHDLAAMERLCDNALLLESGELIMRDTPRKVIEEYLRKTFASLAVNIARPMASWGLETLSLEFSQPDGSPAKTGCPMVACLKYKTKDEIEDATVSISFYWPSGYLCTQLTTSLKYASLTLPAGAGSVEFFCPILTMQRGMYTVDVEIERNGETILQHARCAVLRVDPGTPALGDFYQEHDVKISTTKSPS